MKIGIIDYGMGNLRSVQKAVEHLGYSAFVSSNSSEILSADKIIFPGVGAFGDTMHGINENNMSETINLIIEKNKPLFGICMGMQALFESSEESPGIKGLGIFKGTVKRFKVDLKVPHMGWNQLIIKKDSPIFANLPENPFVYFVHSYYVCPEDPEIIAAASSYEIEFTAAVSSGNIFGTQFHPEKSQSLGLQILDNFCKM